MKRFEFRLARVRDYRRQQVELEEVRLQSICAAEQALEGQRARLLNETADTRRALMVTDSAVSQELAALDSYLRHLAAATKIVGVKLDECRERIVMQQKALVEARRRVRLMEILEERQFREWRTGLDREQENLSSELFLTRWKTS